MIQIFEYRRQMLTRTKWIELEKAQSWIQEHFDRMPIETRRVTYWLVESQRAEVLGLYHGVEKLNENLCREK